MLHGYIISYDISIKAIVSVSYSMRIIVINCNDTNKNSYDTGIYNIIQHEYHSCMTSYHTACKKPPLSVSYSMRIVAFNMNIMPSIMAIKSLASCFCVI